MKTQDIDLESPPKIEGLRFRKFKGETDFPAMLTIIEDAALEDQEDLIFTLADLEHDYEHLINCDPYQDMIFAEIHNAPVAYSRVEWQQKENPLQRVYRHFVNILPKWRMQGIEIALINWSESRLKEIAIEHPVEIPKFYLITCNEKKTWFIEIITAMDYAPERYIIEMFRSLEDIPIAHLPQGVEVRPVIKEHERKIWEASCEAFRDHWSFAIQGDEQFQEYASSKYFQPELWQVAWNDDEIVGSVLNYLDHDYNAKNNRLCGRTEDISTQRKWRKQGIATALIIRSMQMFKALGMKEVALSVDTDSPTGAQKLYQNLGYKKEKTFIEYRKPLQPSLKTEKKDA